MTVGTGLFEIIFQGDQGWGPQMLSIELGIGHGGDSFAQIFHLTEHFGAFRIRGGKILELDGLLRGQRSGLGGEAEKIAALPGTVNHQWTFWRLVRSR